MLVLEILSGIRLWNSKIGEKEEDLISYVSILKQKYLYESTYDQFVKSFLAIICYREGKEDAHGEKTTESRGLEFGNT